jgi:murein DD-endopeptidase MepM/ murein hydrolase activator NlpD
VTFAGQVAGRGVVVLEHADGTRTSLEPVEARVPVGTSVGAGEPVARVQPLPHPGCSRTCVHWGVRVDGRYVDPWWWLGRSGPVRLLPLTDP